MIAGIFTSLWLGEAIANLVFQSGKRRRTDKAGGLFREKRWSKGVKARVQDGFSVQSGPYQSILLAIPRDFSSSRAHYKWYLPGSRYAFNLARYDVLGIPFTSMQCHLSHARARCKLRGKAMLPDMTRELIQDP